MQRQTRKIPTLNYAGSMESRRLDRQGIFRYFHHKPPPPHPQSPPGHTSPYHTPHARTAWTSQPSASPTTPPRLRPGNNPPPAVRPPGSPGCRMFLRKSETIGGEGCRNLARPFPVAHSAAPTCNEQPVCNHGRNPPFVRRLSITSPSEH